jgi:hypothetical protein
MSTTPRTTRLAGFMLALLMTAVIDGTMLWKYDDMAQQTQVAATMVVGQGHLAAARG